MFILFYTLYISITYINTKTIYCRQSTKTQQSQISEIALNRCENGAKMVLLQNTKSRYMEDIFIFAAQRVTDTLVDVVVSIYVFFFVFPTQRFNGVGRG